MVRFEDIKFDCQLYNGYKPCVYGNECAGCPHYAPHDPTRAPWRPTLSSAPLSGLPPSPRIAIIKTGALGDVLRTTTILQPLMRVYPDAHICWITAESALPLLRENPLISDLTTTSPEDVALLMTREFDAVLCLEKEGPQLLLAGRLNAPRHAGYYPTPWGTATIANTEAEYMMLLGVNDDLKFYRNRLSYPQIICEAAGLPFNRDPYILELSPRARAKRDEIQASLTRNTGTAAPVIGLNTGCGAVFRTKQWTLEGWVATAEMLLEKGYGSILLMGGHDEQPLNAEIMRRVPGLIDTGCDNPMEDFFGIIDACDAVVTSDTLGMHVAIARGKYVVALFGSTSHTEIDLYGNGVKVITDFACSPCYLKACDKNPTCMQAMSPASVVDALSGGLQHTEPSARKAS